MSLSPPDLRAAANQHLGRTLKGKWRLNRLLDIGGMAAVFEATHRNGNRVAVKMLHSAFANDLNIRSRFLREGYVANKINHPGAVSIVDDDTDGEAVFLVMELLVGESLEHWLKREGGMLPPIPLLALADQVLSVLAAAHAHGVIHRDIKPGNLFVTASGQVKVLDFGLARLLESDGTTKPTAVGIVLGTTSYMSPEQASGRRDLDGRADLFALGAVLFRSMTGRFIHSGSTQAERVLAALHKRAPAISLVLPELAPEVCSVIDRALNLAKEERYPSAGAMQNAIRKAYASISASESAMPRAQAITDARQAGQFPSEIIEMSDASFDPETLPEIPSSSLLESVSGRK